MANPFPYRFRLIPERGSARIMPLITRKASEKSKPSPPAFQMIALKLLVRFPQVNDALDDRYRPDDDRPITKGQHRHKQHDDAFARVAQQEFVHAKFPQHDGANSRRTLLVAD